MVKLCIGIVRPYEWILPVPWFRYFYEEIPSAMLTKIFCRERASGLNFLARSFSL
jgi:hypothetical protein